MMKTKGANDADIPRVDSPNSRLSTSPARPRNSGRLDETLSDRRMSRAEFFRLGGATAGAVTATGLLAPGPVGAIRTLTQATDPNDPSVKAYGAVGDGIADDTVAIQAAIDDSYGVYFPAGIYKCTTTISLRNASRLVGEATGSDPGIPATQLSFSTLNYARALQGPPGGGGNGHGVTLSNLWIRGASRVAPDIEGAPSFGYYARSQNSALSIVNCSITGFTFNCWLEDVDTAVLLNLQLSNAVRGNLGLWGHCYNVRVLGCDLTVPNETGTAGTAAQLSNIWLLDKPTGWPRSITIQGCVIDEVAKLGQATAPATVRLDRCEDIFISESVIWCPVNDGSGYAVKIGANSRRVSVRDVRVEPYVRDANHVPINTILIDESASGTVLNNVSTDANGGGDIADSASDSVWINVNGVTRLRGGISPGAVDVLPAAGVTNRGQLLRVSGTDTTTADKLYLCVQSSAGTYAWVQMIGQVELDAVSAGIVTRERRLPGTLHGLQNWYDLSEATSYAAVPDLSGNNRITDHRYGNLDPQATTDPAFFGNKRFARFDGANNRALVATSAISGSGLTVMFVGRVAVGAGNISRLFALTDNKGPDFSRAASCIAYHSAANTLTSYRNALLTSSSMTDGMPFALLVTYDGAVNRHQLTEASGSAGVASAGTFGVADLVMGGGKQLANVIGNYALACDVVEVAVWDRALPAADLAALGTYARRRWAL